MTANLQRKNSNQAAEAVAAAKLLQNSDTTQEPSTLTDYLPKANSQKAESAITDRDFKQADGASDESARVASLCSFFKISLTTSSSSLSAQEQSKLLQSHMLAKMTENSNYYWERYLEAAKSGNRDVIIFLKAQPIPTPSDPSYVLRQLAQLGEYEVIRELTDLLGTKTVEHLGIPNLFGRSFFAIKNPIGIAFGKFQVWKNKLYLSTEENPAQFSKCEKYKLTIEALLDSLLKYAPDLSEIELINIKSSLPNQFIGGDNSPINVEIKAKFGFQTLIKKIDERLEAIKKSVEGPDDARSLSEKTASDLWWKDVFDAPNDQKVTILNHKLTTLPSTGIPIPTDVLKVLSMLTQLSSKPEMSAFITEVSKPSYVSSLKVRLEVEMKNRNIHWFKIYLWMHAIMPLKNGDRFFVTKLASLEMLFGKCHSNEMHVKIQILMHFGDFELLEKLKDEDEVEFLKVFKHNNLFQLAKSNFELAFRGVLSQLHYGMVKVNEDEVKKFKKDAEDFKKILSFILGFLIKNGKQLSENQVKEIRTALHQTWFTCYLEINNENRMTHLSHFAPVEEWKQLASLEEMMTQWDTQMVSSAHESREVKTDDLKPVPGKIGETGSPLKEQTFNFWDNLFHAICDDDRRKMVVSLNEGFPTNLNVFIKKLAQLRKDNIEDHLDVKINETYLERLEKQAMALLEKSDPSWIKVYGWMRFVRAYMSKSEPASYFLLTTEKIPEHNQTHDIIAFLIKLGDATFLKKYMESSKLIELDSFNHFIALIGKCMHLFYDNAYHAQDKKYAQDNLTLAQQYSQMFLFLKIYQNRYAELDSDFNKDSLSRLVSIFYNTIFLKQIENKQLRLASKAMWEGLINDFKEFNPQFAETQR